MPSQLGVCFSNCVVLLFFHFNSHPRFLLFLHSHAVECPSSWCSANVWTGRCYRQPVSHGHVHSNAQASAPSPFRPKTHTWKKTGQDPASSTDPHPHPHTCTYSGLAQTVHTKQKCSPLSLSTDRHRVLSICKHSVHWLWVIASHTPQMYLMPHLKPIRDCRYKVCVCACMCSGAFLLLPSGPADL